jgi:hypothetical protein
MSTDTLSAVLAGFLTCEVVAPKILAPLQKLQSIPQMMPHDGLSKRRNRNDFHWLGHLDSNQD